MVTQYIKKKKEINYYGICRNGKVYVDYKDERTRFSDHAYGHYSQFSLCEKDSTYYSIVSLMKMTKYEGIFDVEYQDGKATVTQRTDGDYDISLTAPAAARLLLAGEGHTAQTSLYIDGVELKNEANDFFKAFPHRATRFTDSFWSI